jgi:anthranilate phosphoribosyltransferase
MSRSSDTEARFASFVATLGRGPGRSRALTREEACTAFGMVLRGEADPRQVGAFLMLLRFRGEDADEITGMVQAARAHAGLGRTVFTDACPAGASATDAVLGGAPLADEGSQDAEFAVDLDWPSYGAGRTRGAPWFLLSALALARSGVTILMHGSNDFSSGIDVSSGLQALGLQPAEDMAAAGDLLRKAHFAYLPLRAMAPGVDRLLEMRRLFGLRSPVNTVARLLNPADAPFGVDGVFHPPYIDVHLGVAEHMGRRRLLVLKGGGGEAERVPLKAVTASVWDIRDGRRDIILPAVEGLRPHPPGGDSADLVAAVWQGDAAPDTPLATIQATIAMALLAMGRSEDPAQAMTRAHAIWVDRHR